MDFRGRAYPIPPHVTHISESCIYILFACTLHTHVHTPRLRRFAYCFFFLLAMDVGRALLKMALGYPLGEKGLEWLKIHLVNLHGAKKK